MFVRTPMDLWNHDGIMQHDSAKKLGPALLMFEFVLRVPATLLAFRTLGDGFLLDGNLHVVEVPVFQEQLLEFIA